MLLDVERARASIHGTKGVRGNHVVSAAFTFGYVFIVPRLARLSERYPELGIDLRLEDRLSELVGEGVDVAVRAGASPPDSTAFIAHPLLTMKRSWLPRRAGCASGGCRESRSNSHAAAA